MSSYSTFEPLGGLDPNTKLEISSNSLISISDAFVEKSIESYGVVNDPNGEVIDQNTSAYITALKESAGNYRLIHPANISVVLNTIVTGSLDKVYLKIDGNWTLASGQKASILDISGWTNFVITGTGVLDGNKSNQTGSTYPDVVGGIISNTSSTQDTSSQTNSAGDTLTDVPPMPVSSTTKNYTTDGLIQGITITNCWNWPICLSGIERVRVDSTTLKNSSSSPQFFDSATDCWFTNNEVYDITDGGFVFYRGNSRCGAYGNNVHDCNQGIGVYAEYDMLPIDSFIMITNNFVWNNKDGGIGITTGMTPPKTNQQRILVSNNILNDNNINGRSGGGSIGIVGAIGVLIKNNIIYGDGSTVVATSTNSTKTYSIFVDGTSENIVIDGNQIADIGSENNPGYGIWLSSTNNCVVSNNTIYNGSGTSGYTNSLLAGSFGSNGSMYNNLSISELASSWDQIYKPSDLNYQQRKESDGTYAISNGLTIDSGDVTIVEGVLSNTNPIKSSVFTVATLPTSSSIVAEGSIAYASDGCKPGEASGSGTGVPVFYSKDGKWYSSCSGTVVTS